MKHPRIKVYCGNCQKWTPAKIVVVTRAVYGNYKDHKVFGCESCGIPHLSQTGKYIEDYTILCRNYNVEWPTKVIEDVQKT